VHERKPHSSKRVGTVVWWEDELEAFKGEEYTIKLTNSWKPSGDLRRSDRDRKKGGGTNTFFRAATFNIVRRQNAPFQEERSILLQLDIVRKSSRQRFASDIQGGEWKKEAWAGETDGYLTKRVVQWGDDSY